MAHEQEESLEESLKKTLDEAEWAWLAPHAKRGVLVWVSAQLDLLEVGVALAQDNKAKVQEWLQKGLLTKHSPGDTETQDPSPEERFMCLIVEPFVLVHLHGG